MLSSAVLLRTALAVLMAVTATLANPLPTSTQGSSSPYLLVIVMDGFRPDYATLAPMHHLRALMARGMSYDNAWVGQLESETPTGHATIATGVYPRKHGVIGFGWRDPASGGYTYAPTNLKQMGQGYLRQTMQGGGVPTLSDLVHQHNPHDLAVSLSGEKLWASAPLGAGADYLLYGTEIPQKSPNANKFRAIAVGPNVPPRSTHYTSVSAPDSAFAYQDGFAASLAVQFVRSLRPRAMLVNLPAPDIAGHYFGALSSGRKNIGDIVKGTDAAIGKVLDEYQRLGMLDHTVVVVTADHGMVAGLRRVPIHAIYNEVAASGVHQLDQELRTSLGSIWLRDPEHAASLAADVASHHFAGVEGALYKVPNGPNAFKFEPEPSTAARTPPALLRAYLDLADTEASPAGPEVVLPYGENTTGLPKTHKFHGMHGGVSWNAQHIPLVIIGPGVKHGVSHFPAQLVDIAPTIEHLMGWQVPAGVDGVVLTDATARSTAAERAAQSAVRAPRSADVEALRAHSLAQLAGK